MSFQYRLWLVPAADPFAKVRDLERQLHTALAREFLTCEAATAFLEDDNSVYVHTILSNPQDDVVGACEASNDGDCYIVDAEFWIELVYPEERRRLEPKANALGRSLLDNEVAEVFGDFLKDWLEEEAALFDKDILSLKFDGFTTPVDGTGDPQDTGRTNDPSVAGATSNGDPESDNIGPNRTAQVVPLVVLGLSLTFLAAAAYLVMRRRRRRREQQNRMLQEEKSRNELVYNQTMEETLASPTGLSFGSNHSPEVLVLRDFHPSFEASPGAEPDSSREAPTDEGTVRSERGFEMDELDYLATRPYRPNTSLVDRERPFDESPLSSRSLPTREEFSGNPFPNFFAATPPQDTILSCSIIRSFDEALCTPTHVQTSPPDRRSRNITRSYDYERAAGVPNTVVL